MPAPRVLILRAPGTNCNSETAFAFEQAGAIISELHVNQLLESPSSLHHAQVLCIPGGFSYGDDIAAGRILANQIRHHLADAFKEFRDAGKLLLGICNGFQVLLKTGLLVEDDDQGARATLAWNNSGKFEDRWVELGVNATECVFLQGIESMFLPIAHAEGRFTPRDDRAFDEMQAAGQLAMEYLPRYAEVGASGQVPYPANPNGAVGNVAGVCDPSGRVFGLMPHPERFIHKTQHPRWTRETLPEEGDGLQLFKNAVEYFS